MGRRRARETPHRWLAVKPASNGGAAVASAVSPRKRLDHARWLEIDGQRQRWPRLPSTLHPLFGVRPYQRRRCDCRFALCSPWYCPNCDQTGWDDHPEVREAQRHARSESQKARREAAALQRSIGAESRDNALRGGLGDSGRNRNQAHARHSHQLDA